jgi:uncharacterized protein
MINRNIYESVVSALSDSPAVFLAGPRQAGKTTLARMIASTVHRAHYVTLDTSSTLAAAAGDPEGFVAGLPTPVVIDEVQRASGLFLAIKAAIDADRRPGRFLLTGSANVAVLPMLAEALVGRVEVITLWPLSHGEMAGVHEGFVDALFEPQLLPFQPRAMSRSEVAADIVRGGFPSVVERAQPSRRRAWLRSYVELLLQREIRALAGLEQGAAFARLLALTAARCGTLLNIAELARAAQLTESTAKRYLALAEAAFVIARLPPWSVNLGKRLIKSPKIMLNDTGLAAALMGADEQRLLDDGSLFGPLLETWVVGEVRRQATWAARQVSLYFLRTSGGIEVDLVLEDAQGRCVGIEVKGAAAVSQHDCAGLRLMADELGKRFVRGVVLYLGAEIVPFTRTIVALPLSALWQCGARP